MRRVAIAIGAVAVVVAACAPVAPPHPTPDPSPTSVFEAACQGSLVASTSGTIASSDVTELSGLSASQRNDGVLWVHNDSGDSARVFAVGTDGLDLGEYRLQGASAVDWEDIAVGPGPSAGVSYLYVGDIGDNSTSRSSVQVYRVPEPAVDASAGTPTPQTLSGVETLTVRYPDGAHNAEALLADPVTEKLFIVTKSSGGVAQVFRAPANLAGGSTTTLAQVATVSLGALVTAADVSVAGDVVALRTYSSVVVFPRPSGSPLADAFSQSSCAGAVGTEIQGEALGFTKDGLGYVTASEGSSPALHAFRTP